MVKSKRARKTTSRKPKKATYEQACAAAPILDRRIAEAAERYTLAYEGALVAYRHVQSIMAAEGAELVRLREWRTNVQKVIDLGPQESTVISERVDNPYLTNGLRENIPEGESEAMLITASKNLEITIGGLARIVDRSVEQTLAAAKLRMLYEASQIGGAKAQDYSAVKVDTSGMSQEAIAEMGARARQQYADAVQAIGMVKSSIVERVIIHDVSLRELASSLGFGDSGGARKKAKHQLFDSLNSLVDHFGLLAGAGAKPKLRQWSDGPKPGIIREAA